MLGQGHDTSSMSLIQKNIPADQTYCNQNSDPTQPDCPSDHRHATDSDLYHS